MKNYYASNSQHKGDFPRGSEIWRGIIVYQAASEMLLSKAGAPQIAAGALLTDLVENAWSECDENGVVLRIRIRDTAIVLDLRNDRDSETWQKRASEAEVARRRGVSAVFDPATGKIEVMDASAFEVEGLEPRPSMGPRP